ncbi:MAG: L,D-transpeptidase [Acidobacteria bacterium]|nr:L,D-transpeptidase [Acidobacteriota bacterium]
MTFLLSSWTLAGGVALAVPPEPAGTAQPIAQAAHRPEAWVEYRVEQPVATERGLARRFTASQIALLEKLNRADAVHLPKQTHLVLPSVWHDDELQYSPFPTRYPAAAHLPKLLVVDKAAQAFAAYERGRLLRWGPVSSGRRTSPTPSGWFHLNWRSPGRHSTVNSKWYMKQYFNFDNAQGLALHAYVLPGYPASHACIRLLVRDAIWIYDWGDGWTLDRRGQVVEQGTPLLVLGEYAFDAEPPWRSLDRLARGIDLPDVWGPSGNRPFK